MTFSEYPLPAWVSESLPAYLDCKPAASFTTSAGPTLFVTARCDCGNPFKGADRRGAKATERAIDDLAAHCVTHHEHRDVPDIEPLMWSRYSVGKQDQRWWWRGYLSGMLAPNDVERPQFRNVGGASNRLKQQWRNGFEVSENES